MIFYMQKAYTASAIATERDPQGNIRDITYTGKTVFSLVVQ